MQVIQLLLVAIIVLLIPISLDTVITAYNRTVFKRAMLSFGQVADKASPKEELKKDVAKPKKKRAKANDYYETIAAADEKVKKRKTKKDNADLSKE